LIQLTTTLNTAIADAA